MREVVKWYLGQQCEDIAEAIGPSMRGIGGATVPLGSAAKRASAFCRRAIRPAPWLATALDIAVVYTAVGYAEHGLSDRCAAAHL